MSDIYITAVNSVSQADLANARLGQRFGRMDLSSQLCLLAVEPFAPLLAKFARDRIGLVLATQAGSLPTDVAYWNGRDEPGGLSPTLFTYTLPSAALGRLASPHPSNRNLPCSGRRPQSATSGCMKSNSTATACWRFSTAARCD